MWFEELDIVKVVFNTQKSNLTYQFIQGMWSEESGMIKVLFNTWSNNNMELNK